MSIYLRRLHRFWCWALSMPGSLFATPLATIYGWEMAAVKVTFTICMMSFCVGGLIGVRVLRRFACAAPY